MAHERERLGIRSEVLTAAFVIYFATVVSGAILVASGTTGPWYDAATSFTSYAIFLLAYLVILVAIPILGAVGRRANGDNHPLTVLAGPALVAAACAGVAAIFLPAAGGFLQTNFRLNTATLLSMAYSWAGLVIYFAVAAGLVLRPKRPAIHLPS